MLTLLFLTVCDAVWEQCHDLMQINAAVAVAMLRTLDRSLGPHPLEADQSAGGPERASLHIKAALQRFRSLCTDSPET